MLALALVLVGAVLSGLPGTAPTVATGYGRGGYPPKKKCGRGCYKNKCRTGCKSVNRTCIYCAKQDGRESLNACKATSASKADLKACKDTVKAATKVQAKNCAPLKGQCSSCCGANYTDACRQSFSGTSGFGTYFRSVKHYGKTRRYKPECDGADGGDGDNCSAGCERDAVRQGKVCDKGSKKGGDPTECHARVAAALQACLAACSPASSTTTTTIPPAGSPGRAFTGSGG